MAKAKYLKMKTPQDIRKSINRISNMLLNDQIEPKVANALIYGCNSALNSLRIDEMQAKINELEEFLAENNIKL